jgi:hypothetical protein
MRTDRIDPRKIVVVSVMLVQQKNMKLVAEMDDAFHYWKEKLQLSENEHFFDVDYRLPPRTARMFKESGIDFQHLPSKILISRWVFYGAGTIFGSNGE